MFRATQYIVSRGIKHIGGWRAQDPSLSSLSDDHGKKGLVSQTDTLSTGTGERVVSKLTDSSAGTGGQKQQDQNRKTCNTILSSVAEAVGWSTAAVLGWQLSQPLKGRFEERGAKQRNHSLCSLLYEVASNQPGQKSHVLPRRKSAAVPSTSEAVTSQSTEQPSLTDIEDSEDVRQLRQLQDAIVRQCENQAGVQLSPDDPLQAILCFSTAANLGCSRAMFNLGICYELGIGTDRDYKQAAEWYRRAAAEGHTTAMYNLGIFYLEGKEGVSSDQEKGTLLLTKAAKAGLAEAGAALEVIYNPQTQLTQAYSNPDLQYYSGLTLEHGWGVKADVDKATELFSSAAMTGHMDALYQLGDCYESGTACLPRDPTFAMQLYHLAADQGHQRAGEELTRLQAYDAVGCLKDVLRNNSRLPKSASYPMLRQTTAILSDFDRGPLNYDPAAPFVFSLGGSDIRLTNPAVV